MKNSYFDRRLTFDVRILSTLKSNENRFLIANVVIHMRVGISDIVDSKQILCTKAIYA